MGLFCRIAFPAPAAPQRVGTGVPVL